MRFSSNIQYLDELFIQYVITISIGENFKFKFMSDCYLNILAIYYEHNDKSKFERWACLKDGHAFNSLFDPKNQK